MYIPVREYKVSSNYPMSVVINRKIMRNIYDESITTDLHSYFYQDLDDNLFLVEGSNSYTLDLTHSVLDDIACRLTI